MRQFDARLRLVLAINADEKNASFLCKCMSREGKKDGA